MDAVTNFAPLMLGTVALCVGPLLAVLGLRWLVGGRYRRPRLLRVARREDQEAA